MIDPTDEGDFSKVRIKQQIYEWNKYLIDPTDEGDFSKVRIKQQIFEWNKYLIDPTDEGDISKIRIKQKIFEWTLWWRWFLWNKTTNIWLIPQTKVIFLKWESINKYLCKPSDEGDFFKLRIRQQIFEWSHRWRWFF